MGAEADDSRDLRLDVSELEPPEPFVRILEAVQQLQAGRALWVTHRREPYPLYQALAEAGFHWRTRRRGPDRYEIVIWRSGDAAAEARLGPADPPSEITDRGCT